MLRKYEKRPSRIHKYTYRYIYIYTYSIYIYIYINYEKLLSQISIYKFNRRCLRCRRASSVRANSYFAGSRISLRRHMHCLWKWAQSDSLKVMEIEGIASRKVLVKFARKYREVAWEALLRHPIPQLGGPGVIIQIDESKFNHKSKVGTQHDPRCQGCF